MEKAKKTAAKTGRETRYHVIELSVVTDESIEDALNTESAEGWLFDSIHFVVRDSSRRPSMAFMIFVREAGEGSAD